MELSRGFQNYVLRKIGDIDNSPITYTLHKSMDFEDLDLFLKGIEEDYNVKTQKLYSDSSSQFIVLIMKK